MDKVQFLNDRQLPFAKVLGLKYLVASEAGGEQHGVPLA